MCHAPRRTRYTGVTVSSSTKSICAALTIGDLFVTFCVTYIVVTVDVYFKTRKLARVFNSERELKKRYGDRMARTIAIRLAVLKNARNLSMVPASPPDRLHKLAGKRKNQYAVDLVQPWRLVFEPAQGAGVTGMAAGRDVGGARAITIVEVVDYH